MGADLGVAIIAPQSERNIGSNLVSRNFIAGKTMGKMELPDIDLDGRVVSMTGAGRGLGRAMSLGLAEKGARLVLASPVMDGLNAVAEEIAAIAGPGRGIPTGSGITLSTIDRVP